MIHFGAGHFGAEYTLGWGHFGAKYTLVRGHFGALALEGHFGARAHVEFQNL